ncbi:MAG: hypothetical protein ACI8VT_004485 [Saprospiraceae bacterium]|jgi:hypothetical protein
MQLLNQYKPGLFFMFLLALAILPTGCSKQAIQTAGVHYVGNQNKSITLTSTGFGKNKKDAIFNAEKNAFDVLLFKGVPGSPYEKPIVTTPESTTKSKNANFFKGFYDEYGYKGFVTNSRIISPGSKDKQTNKIMAGVEITINVPSLRRNLEQQGITQKFGL